MNMFLLMALSCPSVEILNLSGVPWTQRDSQEMLAAQDGCKRLYKEQPCLVKFIKVREDVYRATCGEERG